MKKNGKALTLKYGGFYQYLPFKVPEILVSSKIDPLNINPNTLLNNRHPSVHVIGNIAPTVYSFYAVNYMAHIVAKNILNMEIKSDMRALYEGDSAFSFWTSSDSVRYFAMNYKSTKFPNNIGSSKYSGKVLSIDRKKLGNKEVSFYLNGCSYGLPYYLMSPRVKEARKNLIP